MLTASRYNPMPRFRTACVFAVAVAGSTVSVSAQETFDPSRSAAPLRPLDQIIEDLGPARTSLRRVEPGLSVRSAQESRVYQRAGGDPQSSIDDSDRLIYLDRGINATFDRSRYLVTEEGDILQAIPANTMFHLDPPDVPQPATTRPAGVVRPHQVTGRTSVHVDAPTPPTISPDRPEGDVAAARAHYHRAVLGALDRLIAAERPGGGRSPSPSPSSPAAEASVGP